MFNGGFIVTEAGVKAQLFVLTCGDREHRNFLLAVGIFPVESTENYRVFLGMPMRRAEIERILRSVEERFAFMHDRHLSMKPAAAAEVPEMLDRCDIVHLCRNIAVRYIIYCVFGHSNSISLFACIHPHPCGCFCCDWYVHTLTSHLRNIAEGKTANHWSWRRLPKRKKSSTCIGPRLTTRSRTT